MLVFHHHHSNELGSGSTDLAAVLHMDARMGGSNLKLLILLNTNSSKDWKSYLIISKNILL